LYIFRIFLYFTLAAVTFFAFDLYLWHDPVDRLTASLSFHAQYAQGTHVQEVGYPWYQSLLWVSRSYGFVWHTDIFFYMGIDGLIFLLALPGLWLDRNQRRWVVVWVVTSMLAMFVWPTKWPQYTLVVLPAFCLAASTAVYFTYEQLKEQEMYWEWFHNMFPRPSRRYFIIATGLLGLLIFGVLVTQTLNAINRIGWSELNSEMSGLPNNGVNDIQALPDGRMLIGTDGGAAIWKAASGAEVQDEWKVFNPRNSSLPDQHVLSVTQDREGVLWFGTEAGLASYDGKDWVVYRAGDFGLTNEQINTIAVDDQNRIWIGTLDGAAMFDGIAWTAITEQTSSLEDNTVFSIAVQNSPTNEVIWFGTLSGVSSLNSNTGDWYNYTRQEVDLGWGGVSDLMFDSSGTLWVCTEGGGINLWNGQVWTHIRVSNSQLPYNIVETVAELEPGVFWIASSIPNSAGGVLAKYDGTSWHIYKEGFTGYSGGETVTIDNDSKGRYWFGTRNNGISLYAPKK